MKVYEIITNRIIEKLEVGIIPWHKPWRSVEGMPKNLISKKEYRGINVFMLAVQGYESPYWLSCKQAGELGGNVKKGEKGTPVIFWNWINQVDDEGIEKNIPFLRYYTVFNVAQCENIDESKIPVVAAIHNNFDHIAECEAIIANMPNCPEIQQGKQRASYNPLTDIISMPRFDSFVTAEEFYSTLYHEAIHSAGSEKRLNRLNNNISSFGNEEYSKEELVAEMGAAFLCGLVGIENITLNNSAAYIQGWLKALKDDKKLVIMAAAQAQKAADYILMVNKETN
jgi:antirestriction protein ArdC